MRVDETCGTCRYYERDAQECRRFPPRPQWKPIGDRDLTYVMPIVHDDFWCGEYRRGRQGGRIPV